MRFSRRRFIQAAAAATTALPYLWTSSYARSQDKNSRLGMIGCGGKGRDDARLAAEHGDFIAVCDVDRRRAESYTANPTLNGDGQRKLDVYTDHKKMLERDDIDAVICATPDHWHTPVYVDALRAGKHGSHMGNFFKCIETGAKPISDVVTVGNGTVTCHLANIALRLGRTLEWDPAAEAFVDDKEANSMLSREQREGYQIEA